MTEPIKKKKKIQIATLIIQSYSLILRNERDVLLKFLLFPLEFFFFACVCAYVYLAKRKDEKRARFISTLDDFIQRKILLPSPSTFTPMLGTL